jgi:hypothetical protein
VGERHSAEPYLPLGVPGVLCCSPSQRGALGSGKLCAVRGESVALGFGGPLGDELAVGTCVEGAAVAPG